MRLHEIEVRKEALARGDDVEDDAKEALPKAIEWRKGHARKFILAGLGFCAAYSKSDKWNSSEDKPGRLLRIKGAAMVLGYTGNLDEFRRKPNQPTMRIGNRPTSPDEPKSTVEDLCQEIENVTRILPRNPAKGTHFSLFDAFTQGRLSQPEYVGINIRILKLQAQYPTKEAMGAAADEYAKQIGLIFEGAFVEPSKEQKLEYSEDTVQQLIADGHSEEEILSTMELMGIPRPDPVIAHELEPQAEAQVDNDGEQPDPNSDLY